MNDLRFAFRQLRNAPAFTITALATVAICLGANLAIFAVMDSILLRPLPFPRADRLVTIFNTYPKAGVERDVAWKARVASLSDADLARLKDEIAEAVQPYLDKASARLRLAAVSLCASGRR